MCETLQNHRIFKDFYRVILEKTKKSFAKGVQDF